MLVFDIAIGAVIFAIVLAILGVGIWLEYRTRSTQSVRSVRPAQRVRVAHDVDFESDRVLVNSGRRAA